MSTYIFLNPSKVELMTRACDICGDKAAHESAFDDKAVCNNCWGDSNE
jgi:hypothetical protein